MKRRILTALLLAAFAAEGYAQQSHTVNFTINGRITAKTCTVVGTTDKTIRMADKDIGEFANASTGTKVYGGANEYAEVNCPANQTINVSFTDTAPSAVTNQAYLRNISTNSPASNVGVSVRITNGTNNSGGSELNTGQTYRFRQGSTTDFTTMSNVKIYVHPSYYVIQRGVTPGEVQARMTLNIAYQ